MGTCTRDFFQIQIEYRGQLVKVWQHVSMIEPIPLEYEDDFYDRWSLDYPETTMIRGLVIETQYDVPVICRRGLTRGLHPKLYRETSQNKWPLL